MNDIKKYQKFIFFVFGCLFPLVSWSATKEVVAEKRIGVAMRMIGHEVLKCSGDLESRVLPIEKVDEHYIIPFDVKFGFDPDNIISIVRKVIADTKIANHYLVAVQECETKKIVHSFEIGNPSSSDLLTCEGRIMPVDCYSLLFTILDHTDPEIGLKKAVVDNSSFSIKKSTLFTFTLLLILFFLLGSILSSFKKQKTIVEKDPNLILIGSSQFDKKHRALSFGNKRVELSNKEADLLSLLHTSANTPLEREVILKRVWGDEGDYVGRTLDVFISKLRKKLEADETVKIVNIRGVGYKLVMDVPR